MKTDEDSDMNQDSRRTYDQAINLSKNSEESVLKDSDKEKAQNLVPEPMDSDNTNENSDKNQQSSETHGKASKVTNSEENKRKVSPW